jgi:hypothetical protein
MRHRRYAADAASTIGVTRIRIGQNRLRLAGKHGANPWGGTKADDTTARLS